MNWDDFDFEGVAEALQDGKLLRTGAPTKPPGLSAIIYDPEEERFIDYGDSRYRHGEIGSDEPASILKAIELAGKSYLDEELPDYTVEQPDALSNFLIENSARLESEFDGTYRLTLNGDLTVEGENFHDSYRSLQNELWSELDI